MGGERATMLPTTGIKFYETNEKELLFEPSIKWAGNPNIVLVIKLMSLRIKVQVCNRRSFHSPLFLVPIKDLDRFFFNIYIYILFAACGSPDFLYSASSSEASSPYLPLFRNRCSFIDGKGKLQFSQNRFVSCLLTYSFLFCSRMLILG